MQCELKIKLDPNGLGVVVGGGASGLAAAKLLTRLGLSVRLLEKKERSDLAQTAKEHGWEIQFGEHHAAQFEGASVIVPSPGLALSKLLTFIPAGMEALAKRGFRYPFPQYGIQQDAREGRARSYSDKQSAAARPTPVG